MRIADYHPSQRAGIIFGVFARVRFHALVSLRGAVFKQLLRHGPQIGGGNERALDVSKLAFCQCFFLRVSCCFFRFGGRDLADEDFFLDACNEKPAGTDTSSMRRADRRRLTCTDFNFVENWRP